MRQWGFGKVRAVIAALAVSLALSGCTIPFINVEVPINAPDLSNLPIPNVDLSELDIKPITLPIGVTTSVEEARQSVLSNKAAALDSTTVVVPGYLTVGVKVTTSSAPTCVQGDGGQLYGLDVDVAAAIASELGLKVRYVPVIDGSTLGTQCDVVMNARSSDPQSIAIVGSYVESATSFFYRGLPNVLTPTDFGGKSVGLQNGSVSETVLNRTGLKMSQQPYPSLNEAFEALSAGQVDFVLCEAYPGGYLASLHPGVSFAGSLEAPENSGIAVSASNTALVGAVQTAFDTISGNGVLQGLRSRWVGTMPALTTDSQVQNVPEGNSSASATSPDQSGDGASNGSEAGSNAITSV
ncbi:MAG: amino acid ABC transporter substrate-binding protein [Atopobiaceae bacterium]|nr:amino acid ABC transporter substrate-binding protein [Atopobiaceae bacterium]